MKKKSKMKKMKNRQEKKKEGAKGYLQRRPKKKIFLDKMRGRGAD